MTTINTIAIDIIVPLQLNYRILGQFTDLGLSAEILSALEEIGFEQPTEIQEKIIPQLLETNPDCIGLAQTGTGKTAAFSLPLLDLVDESDSNVQALILAPTRELARQIDAEIKNFSKYKKGLSTYVVYGGAAISAQIKDIKSKKPQIIVATPGRLIDLINRKVVKPQNISHLVLDEADEMLNMGFQEDIDYILKFTPEGKKTWLFSATMPKEIRRIINNYMTDPIEVKAEKNITNSGNLEHKFVVVERKHKLEALKRFVDAIPDMYGVVFCRTRRDTQEVAEALARDGYGADAIHGDLSQAQRESVMKKFRSGMTNLLVATDVAARGIDVNNLTHVIHHALPDTAEYYTHRSGRTARAGRSGVSIVFVTGREQRKMQNLLRPIGIDIERTNVPTYEEVRHNRLTKWAEDFTSVDIEKLDPEIYQTLAAWLQPLSKEEVIKRLVAQQLSKLSRNKSRIDFNAPDGKKSRKERRGGDREGRRGERRDSRNDRGGRPERGTRGRSRTAVKMFINLGKMDNMGPGDIAKFVAHHADVSHNDIGDIRIQKMNASFDLDRRALNKVKKNFKNVKLGGRDIRCNPQ